MSMNIIIKELESEIIIKKSKFIGIIKKINNFDDINNILDNIKEKYHDATHICYAYILNNQKKYFDDKEPTGTAGIPILNVLEKNKLNYCIAIVVRYFGGIKLGSSNLLRAYQNSISNILENNIKEISYSTKIRITTNYKDLKNIKFLLNDSLNTKEENLKDIII